jgi:hypothetical protein
LKTENWTADVVAVVVDPRFRPTSAGRRRADERQRTGDDDVTSGPRRRRRRLRPTKNRSAMKRYRKS